MNEIATNDFDYSLLDEKTKEFLEERANIIYGTDMGVLKNGIEVQGLKKPKLMNISIITISFVRKTNKQILKNSKVCLKRYKLK